RNATARFTATVDLPTPPLPDETAIVCRTSGIMSAGRPCGPAAGACACAWPGAAGPAVPAPIFTCTFDTPGSCPTIREAMLCRIALVPADWVVKAGVDET